MTSALAFHQQLEEAKQFILLHDDFLVVSHINPDGDAVSSTCAIGWLLERLGKRFVMANCDSLPIRFSYLHGFSQVQKLSNMAANRKFKYIIAVDCADAYRFAEMSERMADDAVMLNIDHHASNKGYGNVNLIDRQAAATVQVIAELIDYLAVEFNQQIATSLYTGLLTDTGGFRYQNTTSKVMQLASKLLSFDVNPTEIAKIALERVTKSHVAILQKALHTLTIHPSQKIAWIVTNNEDLQATGATADDLDGIVRYPVNLEGIEVGLLFKQLSDKCYKVSFRSNDYIDVADVASEFNGGGHIRAAGATIEGDLDEIIASVVSAIERRLS
jgi:phosphoesterase RecJ-like protein